MDKKPEYLCRHEIPHNYQDNGYGVGEKTRFQEKNLSSDDTLAHLLVHLFPERILRPTVSALPAGARAG